LIPFGIDFSEELDFLEYSLEALNTLINKTDIKQKNIEIIEESEFFHQEYISERNNRVIEDLLGLCYVISQLFITNVKSKCESYVKQFNLIESESKKLNTISLLKMWNELVPGKNIYQIQAINSIANYYKHKDEWDNNWSISRLNEFTIPDIIDLGMDRKNKKNIQMISKLIFNVDVYGISECLFKLLRLWAENISNNFPNYLRAQTI